MSEIEDEIRRQILSERRLAAEAQASPEVLPASPPESARSPLRRWQSGGGWLGILATVLLLLFKLKGVLGALKFLSLGKFLLTGGSMLLSIWLQAFRYGWAMAAGIVLLIFVHECGHAFAGRLRGIRTGAMVFIPFMGAFVTLKRGGHNLGEDAFIGIMGPVFGTIGGVLCVGIYAVTGNLFWLSLAALNFMINLFNLAPVAPLDGGWIVPLFSPKLLAIGAILLLPLTFVNPLIGLLGLLSLPRIIGGWKAKPEEQPYYQATAADRWKFGSAYVGLALFLALSSFLLMDYLVSHRPLVA